MDSDPYSYDNIVNVLADEILQKRRMLTAEEVNQHPLLPHVKQVTKILNQTLTEFYNALAVNKPKPRCRFCHWAKTTYISTAPGGKGRYECNKCGKQFFFPYPKLPRCPYCKSSNTRVGGVQDKILGTRSYKCLSCKRSFRTVRKSFSRSKEYFITLYSGKETVSFSSLLANSLKLKPGSYVYVIEDNDEIIITKGKEGKGFRVSRANKYNHLYVSSCGLCRYLKDKLGLENNLNVTIKTNQEGKIMEIISKKEIRSKYVRGKYAVEKYVSVNRNGSVRISVALINEMGIEPKDQLIILQHEGKDYLSLATAKEIKNDLGFNISMDSKFRNTAVASSVMLAKYLIDRFQIDELAGFRVYTSELIEIKGRKVVRLEKAVFNK